MAGNPVARMYPEVMVDTSNPDPTKAIDAFLWCMVKARELGMSPPTEHVLAEHLFRKSAKVIFYSSMSGLTSLVMDEEAMDDIGDDDMFDFMMSVLKRRKEGRRAKREAQRIEAGTDETPQAVQPEGREPDPEGVRP